MQFFATCAIFVNFLYWGSGIFSELVETEYKPHLIIIIKRFNIKFMESTRQAKIARLLQKELSEIFRRQTAKTHGVIVSVSAVRVSPDLSIARAYLSIFPSEKAQELIESINNSAREIRYELAKVVRFQLRKTPELTFFIDDSLDYIENIDNLLKDKE